MSETPPDLSPQERLNLSRRALVRHMYQDRNSHKNARHDGGETSWDGRDFEDADHNRNGGVNGAHGIWQTLSQALGSWWRSHPAHLAVEVAEPMLERYAAQHPLKLLATAAGVGALVVVAKPWRLVSLTGVAVAALKSTQVSGLLASLLRRSNKSEPDERPRKRGRMSP